MRTKTVLTNCRKYAECRKYARANNAGARLVCIIDGQEQDCYTPYLKNCQKCETPHRTTEICICQVQAPWPVGVFFG